MNSRASFDYRPQRGLALVKDKGSQIKHVASTKYLVPSASGSGGYVVDAETGGCTCPDAEKNRAQGREEHRCKHWYCLTLNLRKEVSLADGTVIVATQKVRFTYPRDRVASNRAAVDLPRFAPMLFQDLVSILPGPPAKVARGRPAVSERDAAYASLMRVFCGKDARQAVHAIETCKSLGLTQRVPHYNTLLAKMARPEMMPALQSLLVRSALPLAAIETQLAIDSTGFSTKVFRRWFDHKWGNKRKNGDWVPQFGGNDSLAHATALQAMALFRGR